MADHGYHATMTRNVAIAGNMHTATICWNPTAVEITFEKRDATDSLLLFVWPKNIETFSRPPPWLPPLIIFSCMAIEPYDQFHMFGIKERHVKATINF